MIRLAAFLIIAIVAVAAILASNRERPIVIDRHSSGQSDFNNASVFHKPGYRFAPCPVWIGPRPQGKVNQA